MEKIMQVKRHKIYRKTCNNENYEYSVFAPDTSPRFDSPDWEADTLQECIDFICSK